MLLPVRQLACHALLHLLAAFVVGTYSIFFPEILSQGDAICTASLSFHLLSALCVTSAGRLSYTKTSTNIKFLTALVAVPVIAVSIAEKFFFQKL